MFSRVSLNFEVTLVLPIVDSIRCRGRAGKSRSKWVCTEGSTCADRRPWLSAHRSAMDTCEGIKRQLSRIFDRGLTFGTYCHESGNVSFVILTGRVSLSGLMR